jgi:hypothetical protein
MAAAPGGSDFTSNASANAAAGIAVFNVFLNVAASSYTITASATGFVDGVSATFDVLP